MTGHTGFFGLFRCDPPDMRLVALAAFHAHDLNMGLVFADIDDILMA